MSMYLGFFICERTKSDEKRKPTDFIIVGIALCVSAMGTLMAANDLWRERVNQYENGEVVKVVTYNIKKVDGNVEKADSTYTFKLRK